MSKVSYPVPGIAQAKASIAAGEYTAADLVRRCLRHVDASACALHAFVARDPEGAMAQARESDARYARGQARLLEGIPLGIKDVIDVAGLPTRGQSRTTAATPARADAAVVQRLRGEGAIVLGKTATWEFAMGEPGAAGAEIATRNPRDLERDPGGSSSGSAAAVAAGLCPAAFGTDTGGSVRGPAAWCGVVGFKPTHGAVSLDGTLPLSPAMDHAGWFTRNCGDARLLLQALRAKPAAPSQLRSRRERWVVGIWQAAYVSESPAEPAVRAAFEDAVSRLQRAGMDVRTLELPSLQTYNAACVVIARAEAHATYRASLRDPEWRRQLEHSTRSRLLFGGLLAGKTLDRAYRLRELLRARTEEAMAGVDAVATPAMPTRAPLRAHADQVMLPGLPLYVRFASCLGLPSVSVPCPAPGDLPVGLLLTGKAGEDDSVLELGAACEAAWTAEARDDEKGALPC